MDKLIPPNYTVQIFLSVIIDVLYNKRIWTELWEALKRLDSNRHIHR